MLTKFTGHTRSWTLFSSLVLLLGLVWIWLSRAPAGSTTAGDIPAPARGFSAPDFTLSDSNGQAIQLSSLRGRTVLVNFWASWCPPCQAEMPAMQRVYQQYADQGFTILAVNTAFQDNLQDAQEFAQELSLTFPILYDQDGSVSRVYQVSSMPTSYFIDPSGLIQEVVIGGPMAEALLISRVQQLGQGALPPP